MLTYALINPFEPYTFLAPTREVAALTVFMLGYTYGAKPHDGRYEDYGIPNFILPHVAEEWYKKEFGRTSEEGYCALRREVADSLDSILLGDFSDREEYEAALSHIANPEEKAMFQAQAKDRRKRNNTVNVGGYCQDIAAAIRQQILEEKNGRKEKSGC